MENNADIIRNSCLLIICPGCYRVLNKCKFIEHCENECSVKNMNCVNKPFGCLAMINAYDIRDHLNNICKYRLKNDNCPCNEEMIDKNNSADNLECLNHCSNCITPSYRNTCKEKNVNCPVINCTTCQVMLHLCKLKDHLENICKYKIVECINKQYGCTLSIPRHFLASHLKDCAASVISCSREWTRDVHGSKLYQLSLDGDHSCNSNLDSKQWWHKLHHEMSLRANQLVTRDLSVGLSLRDQLFLWTFLNNSITWRNLTETPIETLYTSNSNSKASETSLQETLIMVSQFINCPLSLWSSSMDSKYISNQLDNYDMNNDLHINDETSLDEPNWKLQHLTMDQKKPLGTYTFQCGQAVPRREYEGHWRQHCDISSQMDGWIELTCPLVYLGCKFSVLRFCKRQSELVYHPLLDIYCQRYYATVSDNSPQGSSLLLHLPFEILMLICSYLDGCSLFHVCRTHPRLKDAVNMIFGKRCSSLEWSRSPDGNWFSHIVYFRPISLGCQEITGENIFTADSTGALSEHLKHCSFKGSLSSGPDTVPYCLHSNSADDIDIPHFLKTTGR